MAFVMRAGMAAPLLGLSHTRFHVLDVLGTPLCVRADRPPIHPVDYEASIGREFVPEQMRCHRLGCIDGWDNWVGHVNVAHYPVRRTYGGT